MKSMFENLFRTNNWAPIQYKGKQVSIFDDIIIPVGKVTLIVRFESVDSDLEQGIFLKGKGTFLVNDQRIKDAIHLWKKNSPNIVECILESKDGKLRIWNMWRNDNGSMQYGHNGAALYYEEIDHGRRYYCNDGYPDDDFNDLIFSIEINEST